MGQNRSLRGWRHRLRTCPAFPRASMNSGDQGNPGSDTRYSSSANWNNVAPHAVVTRTGRTGCPPGAVVAVAFAKLIVSRRSHAERGGEIAQFATCHSGRKREGRFRKNHDRDPYRRCADEMRPAPGHHRSRQPAADPHPLHRESRIPWLRRSTTVSSISTCSPRSTL